MRKVKYCIGVSLDGYIASADDSFEWLNRATSKAKGEDFGKTELFASIDTVLIGRKSYDVMRKMGGGSGYPKLRNIVFSRTLAPGQQDGVEIVADDPSSFVAELKANPGKDIYLSGGGELARELLRHGAVDEIVLGVVPVLVGSGIPAFPAGFPEMYLDLVECKQYKGGIVGLTYRAAKARVPKAKAGKRVARKATARR